MTDLIKIENVYQSFRSGFLMKTSEVLHNINLTIPERTVFGFLGANGAGKTTLIHLLVGLRRPSKGIIQLRGVNTFYPTARCCIGYLPERPYFHEHVTADGLLRYFGALSGMSRRAVVDRIPRVLSAVGMTLARHVELRNYSKGMLQRIGIAQAILHDPEFLVLDEPMSGLDPIGRKEMRELIISLAQEGKTIFFSTHVIPDVEAICDQVALIQKGRIKGCGPIKGFLATGEDETEIVFSGKSKEEILKLGLFSLVREIPDGLKVQLPTHDVNKAVSKLMQMNASLIWVNPIRPSLESYFETAQERNVEQVSNGTN